MARVKPAQQPGFLSQTTQVQATGSWFAGNLVRWRMGLLEKVGGWRRITPLPFAAIIRKMHAWLDLDDRKNLMIATDVGVELLVQTTVYGLGTRSPIADARFSVTVGLSEVKVTTATVVDAGNLFILELPISIGGRIIAAGDSFSITSVVPGGFTFELPGDPDTPEIPSEALYTETNVVGTRLFTNNISGGMTATWKSHGLNPGDSFVFAKTTSLKLGTVDVWAQVNFTVPAGTVLLVDTVPSVDTFTFLMGGFGTGDGLGTATHQVYDGAVSENGVVTLSAVIGLSVPRPLGNPQKMGWWLDNLGQDGLMLRTGGPLEIYTPPITEGPWTAIIEEAPSQSNGMFVAMPQAQVILLGTLADLNDPESFDPLFIRWSHVGTYNVWIGAVGNQAGSYRLSRGSGIVGGIQAPQTTLILTETDAWAMNYIGPPLVYGFTVMATGCGLIAADAIDCLGRMTYWMGQRGFWQYGEGGVQPLMCTVYDYVFSDIDTINVGKIYAAANSTTNEIAWFFPSATVAKEEQLDKNLLSFSQDFSRWTGVGVQVQEEKVIFAPDFTDTAMKVQETAVLGLHAVSQQLFKLGTQVTNTFSLYVHNSSTQNFTLRAVTKFGGVYARFNPVGGTLVAFGSSVPSFTVLNARVVYDDPMGSGPGGNGWLRYALTFITSDESDLQLFINLTKVTAVEYLGQPPKHLLMWGAQLVNGGEPGDYVATMGIVPQNECTRYVKYNMVEKAWDSGILWRSAWIDSSVWGPPLGADKNKRIQQHEIGYDDDDQPMRDVYAETGYTELGDGSVMLLIDQVQPDFKWFGLNGEVTVTLKTTNYAGGPVQNHERYSMTPGTQFFSVRARARYAAIRYEWSATLGYSARVGATTYRVKQAGKRP